jgi:hypothetical protein
MSLICFRYRSYQIKIDRIADRELLVVGRPPITLVPATVPDSDSSDEGSVEV